MQTVVAPRADEFVAAKPVSKWIFNPITDFFALHAGAGMLVLPFALLGFLGFDSAFTMLATIYSFTLGFPHLAATHVRLNADADCRRQFAWLSWQAPLAIMALVATVLFALHALPYLVFAWFLLQTWHANRQNFGIMRRYMRMADSDPACLVNRLAGAVIEFCPWAPVLYALLWQDARYQGYPLYLPSVEALQPLVMPIWFGSAALLMAYIASEVREQAAGRAVPGRFLCCIAGCAVNFLAWIVSDDMGWGYLVVSIWHSLQYVAYTQAFRSRPPKGYDILQLTGVKHIGLLVLIGAGLTVLFRSVSYYVPAMFAVIHLSLNFHHYLCDTLIWRRPNPQKV